MAAGLTQEELGAAAGLDRTMIVKIESGNRRIDAIELIRLSSALQVPVGSLLRSTPLVLSRRTGVVTEEADTEVARESGRLDLALVAWLREVQQLVELGVLQPGLPLRAATAVDSQMAARELALWVRKQLGMGLVPSTRWRICAERSGQYVLVTDVRGEGASMVEGDVAVAVVSLEGDPGRRRATAAHELGHLVMVMNTQVILGFTRPALNGRRCSTRSRRNCCSHPRFSLRCAVQRRPSAGTSSSGLRPGSGPHGRWPSGRPLMLAFSTHRPVATGDGLHPLEASSWRLWGGHLNRISKPFGFRLATRMPSWRHGGRAR